MVDGAGAILTGCGSYDFCVCDGGWGDGGPAGDVPCFVLIHHAPYGADVPAVFIFVTDGSESAVAQAKAAAGDRVVGVHGADPVNLERDRVIEAGSGVTHLCFRVTTGSR